MSKKHIDIKQTIWSRFTFEDDVDLSNIRSTEDVADILDNNEYEFEDLLETAEDMSVEENSGHSTIEVFDAEENIIWKNGE